MTTDAGATPSGATDESQQLTQEQIEQQKADEEKARLALEEQQKKDEDEARKRAAAPRTSMIDEIAARRNEEIARETQTDDERADQEAEAERKRLEDEAARQEQIDKQTGKDEPIVLTADQLPRYRVRQTIDGRETDVPLADAMRSAQVAGAADYRLAKATETLERAEALLKDAGERGGKAPKKGAESTTGADDTATELEARIRASLDKALDGGVDEAAKELAAVLATARGRGDATLDVDAITAAAVERIKLEQVYTTFQDEYKDVVNDRRLGRMVDDEFAGLIPKDDKGNVLPLSPTDFSKNLKAAGDKVRSWRESIGGIKKPTDAGTDTLEQRKARKENLDQTSGASTRAATTSSSTSSAEPTASERSSVIAQIAKGRGQ